MVLTITPLFFSLAPLCVDHLVNLLVRLRSSNSPMLHDVGVISPYQSMLLTLNLRATASCAANCFMMLLFDRPNPIDPKAYR